jgi:hypothetical protein
MDSAMNLHGGNSWERPGAKTAGAALPSGGEGGTRYGTANELENHLLLLDLEEQDDQPVFAAAAAPATPAAGRHERDWPQHAAAAGGAAAAAPAGSPGGEAGHAGDAGQRSGPLAPTGFTPAEVRGTSTPHWGMAVRSLRFGLGGGHSNARAVCTACALTLQAALRSAHPSPSICTLSLLPLQAYVDRQERTVSNRQGGAHGW